MPRNVEIKAKVEDLSQLKTLAQGLSGGQPTLIEQEDTFFLVPNGRLKLRVLQVGTVKVWWDLIKVHCNNECCNCNIIGEYT